MIVPYGHHIYLFLKLIVLQTVSWSFSISAWRTHLAIGIQIPPLICSTAALHCIVLPLASPQRSQEALKLYFWITLTFSSKGSQCKCEQIVSYQRVKDKHCAETVPDTWSFPLRSADKTCAEGICLALGTVCEKRCGISGVQKKGSVLTKIQKTDGLKHKNTLKFQGCLP